MFAIAPLSASLPGWGRWNDATCPFNTTDIAEPFRSVIVAPHATRRLSMSLHGRFPGRGRRRIFSKAFPVFARHNDSKIYYHSRSSSAPENCLIVNEGEGNRLFSRRPRQGGLLGTQSFGWILRAGIFPSPGSSNRVGGGVTLIMSIAAENCTPMADENCTPDPRCIVYSASFDDWS